MKPSKDAWGDAGGRVMMTSLAALTLEVYYRYLPLYKLDKEEDADRLLANALAAEPAKAEPAKAEPAKAAPAKPAPAKPKAAKSAKA